MPASIDTNLQVSVTNRQILQIALPISASLIIPNVNFITNNIFLGGLGIKELGNAGITGVYYLVLMVGGNGLGNALQAIISRKGGEGKPEDIHKVFAQGIRIALWFALGGMLFTWFVAPCYFAILYYAGKFYTGDGFSADKGVGITFFIFIPGR